MARRRQRAGSYSLPRLLYVQVPVPGFLSPRTVSYPYPSPRQRARRTIRIPLRPHKVVYRIRTVAVRVPRTLPLVPGSYVSIRRGKLNIHSRRQLERQLEAEYNRRRYREKKSRRRQARNGQMESMRGDRFGMVAEAARRGFSPERIADAALVSRALGGS